MRLSHFFFPLRLFRGFDLGLYASGVWASWPTNAGTIRYIWVDSSGDWRTHTSAPSTGSEGTVIGTQS